MASARVSTVWTPSRLISWAGTVSPATAGLVEKILDSKPHPEHAYRACLGIMNLTGVTAPTGPQQPANER
jgi:hypothetical protein